MSMLVEFKGVPESASMQVHVNVCSMDVCLYGYMYPHLVACHFFTYLSSLNLKFCTPSLHS